MDAENYKAEEAKILPNLADSSRLTILEDTKRIDGEDNDAKYIMMGGVRYKKP